MSSETITPADAGDLAIELSDLVEQFLRERGCVLTTFPRAWPQTISKSRWMLTVQIDMEKYRDPPGGAQA